MESNYICSPDDYQCMLGARGTTSGLDDLQEQRDVAADAQKWRAVVARDATKDGLFVFGVRSTGVYCKPSCPAKHPHLENVIFFTGTDEAEHAGFRACRRCKPREETSFQSQLVQRVCEYVNENLDEKLTLENLSRQAGLSPFHFQRVFKRSLGISPRQYVEARRLERLKRSLSRGETVTNAVYAAGFTSRSRLYEKGPEKLGVHPGTFRRGGEGLNIKFTIVDSPIGRLLLGATEKGLCAVCVGGSDEAVEAALKEDYYAASLTRNDDSLKRWAGEFLKYFSGHPFPAGLPIDVQATAFQWKVWKRLQSIPYGSTASYSTIAASLGEPKATRAVARACATNPVAIIVPCHRVLGKDGTLHGYRWGVKTKRALLTLEAESKNMSLDA